MAQATLKFDTKGAWTYFGGIGALVFGCLTLWLVVYRPGEENGWVPWVVGTFFTGLGLFTLMSRSRVVFDPVSRRWRDSFGFLCFEFSDAGSFSQLNKIQIEESEGTHGVITRYIYVIGRPKIQLMIDIANDSEEAHHIAKQLQSVLDLPIETIRN
ncbi:MAG: hypothetical protein Kow0060_21910 [Methylohalobius crimeensis]